MDNRKTIFLVDDNPTNLEAAAKALESQYEVLRLNSGQRLLKKLERSIPDLILLDIEMPEMNGYEALRQIKSDARTAHVPVIFLTAKDETENELEGLTLGAIDYITKPFSPPLLLKRIEVHLLVDSQKKELLAQRNELAHFNAHLSELVEAKTKTVVELQGAVIKTMANLVEERDDVTGGHIERTQRYLKILINAMMSEGLYEKETAGWNIDLLLQSSQLHDVGKIRIKDSVLLKPGRLNEEELTQIREHTSFGELIIERLKDGTTDHSFAEYAQVFVATHHEQWDGSGYPNGLAGEEIPLLGRIMAIADVYDALVSDRPYKKAFSHEEAAKIIVDGSGSHFDPALVDLFRRVSGQFESISDGRGHA
jgi:putative two-component system response regulator